MTSSLTNRRTFRRTVGRRTRVVGRVAVSVALSAGALAASAASVTAAGASAPGRTNLYFYPGQANARFAALRGAGYEQRVLSNESALGGTSSASPITAAAPASWTALGPAPEANGYGGNNSGRVTGLAVTPGSSPTIYLAAAGGGVWSTVNGGASWATHTDSQPDIAMGAVAVDPSNASYVFGGTGEDNQCLDCHYGAGVMESTNGGVSWTTSNPGGIFTGINISTIVVEPGASSLSTTTVLLGTSNGLWASTDGGATWTATTGGGWTNGNVNSLVINTLTSPVSIYAAVEGVGVELSTDNGSTWSTVQTYAYGTYANGALAIVPNATLSSVVLYDSVGSSSGYVGFYKSVDGGTTWTQIPNCNSGTSTPGTDCVPYYTSFDYGYGGLNSDVQGDQSWYDNVVAVDPLNPNIVVAGGVTMVESTDGGQNWTNLNGGGFGLPNTYFHPDFHALAFDSAGNLYFGNDGGVWEMPAANVATATAPTNGYVNLNTNLNITQFYAGLSESGNASQVLAGAQDNGTNLYSSSASPSSTWNEVLGGDGGFTAIDQSNPQIQLAEADVSSGGGLYETTDAWHSVYNQIAPPTAYKIFASNNATYSSNWIAPAAFVPGSAGPAIVFGGNGIYLWDGVTYTSPGVPSWVGPLGYGSSSGMLVSALAISPSNASILYAGYSDGTIEMSSDGGSTWTTVVSANNVAVTHIAVNATNPYTIYYSSVSGTPGAATYQPAAPVITMATATNSTPVLSDLTGNLPANVPSMSVITDGASGLIVANDVGVFWASTLNGANTVWRRLGTGLPNTQVMDVYLTNHGTLIADTHGRGAWTIPFSAGTSTTPTICTWIGGSGAGGSNWSVGSNWSTTSGASCTGAGGPPAGAQIVFPANPATTTVTWDTGLEANGGGAPATSFDSITVASAAYTFTNANSAVAITLTPTLATSCGSGTIGLCADFTSGNLTFPIGVTLGSGQEFAATAGATFTLSGALAAQSGFGLALGDATDTGTIVLSGIDTGVTSQTTIVGGTGVLRGSLANSTVDVSTGATFDGAGPVASLSNNGGTIIPGDSASSPATLTSSGTVYLQAVGTGTFGAVINGATAGSGYSQLSSSAPVNLSGATLSVSDSYVAPTGTSFVLISLSGGTYASGTFNNLPNNSTFTAGGRTLQITYPSQNGGSSSEAVVLTDISAATVPGAPSISSLSTPASGEVTVNWSAPVSNGGSAITDYLVRYSSDGGSTWSSAIDTGSTSTSYTVTGLNNGTAYVFDVAAVNAVGTSNYSSASSPVTPATVPGAPTSAAATAGNTNATVTWTAPVSNGGSAITDYLVRYSSDGGSTWSSAIDTGSTSTSYTVTGLNNGTAYVFDVAAVNAVGTSNYSSASSPVTPATVPGAPTITSAVAGTGLVTVSWNAPSIVGSGVTDYLVRYSSDGGSTWSSAFDTGSTSTSYVIINLGDGTPYVFDVAAINANGVGAYSSASLPATPFVSPTGGGTGGGTPSTGPATAPPPPLMPSSSFGTPVSFSASCSGVTTGTVASGATTGTLTVPNCALPSGTTISLYPVLELSAGASGLPTGQALAEGIAVSWETPTNTSPAALSPLALTFTNSNITAGETIYEVTASGLVAVGTTAAGSASVTLTSDSIYLVLATTTAPQVPLSLTTTTATVGVPLVLGVSGGSGTGAVTLSVANGTASGCTLNSGALSATSPGTCVVTVAKAGDAKYQATSATVSVTVVPAALPPRPAAIRTTFVAGSAVLSVATKHALTLLASKLVAGATVKFLGYAPGNTKLAHLRSALVAKFLVRLVRVHVVVQLVTRTKANLVIVVTTKA